ncbi:hypothetical protein B0H11DRAFT_2418969 [Mycena galericulata]|nr:hypothetical protein B0H11DRAFT_2418969 [Mycena galericulata]
MYVNSTNWLAPLQQQRPDSALHSSDHTYSPPQYGDQCDPAGGPAVHRLASHGHPAYHTTNDYQDDQHHGQLDDRRFAHHSRADLLPNLERHPHAPLGHPVHHMASSGLGGNSGQLDDDRLAQHPPNLQQYPQHPHMPLGHPVHHMVFGGPGGMGYPPVGLAAVQHTDDAASKETQYLHRRCFNCHTTKPPSWRRSTLNPGKIVCNKCGLYERTHLRARPLRFEKLRVGNKAPKEGKGVGGGSPMRTHT